MLTWSQQALELAIADDKAIFETANHYSFEEHINRLG